MKFCKYCGKELKENEVCSCQSEKVSTTEGNLIQKLWNVVVNLVKKPATTVENYIKESNDAMSYIFIGLATISFALIFVLGIQKAIDTMGMFSSYIKVDYFKVFVAFAAMILSLLFGMILVSWLVMQKIYKYEKYDYKKSLSLVGVSSIPMTILNLVAVLIILLFGKSIFTQTGLIFLIMLVSFGSLAFYTLFISNIKFASGCDNDKSFIGAFIIILAATIIMFIVSKNIATPMLTKVVAGSTIGSLF